MPIALDIPRIPDAQIVIDGSIDETAWAQAFEVKGFKVYRPEPDTDPASDTVVRILSDDQTLYVSFAVADAEPSLVRAGMGRRDTRNRDDYVGMVLDPLGTGERAAVFIVNPLGIQMDGTHVRGRDKELVPFGGSFTSWDARWTSAGKRTAEGYTVELAIPWTNIRHPNRVEKVGALFFRHVARTAERSAWPPLDPDETGVLPQLQELGGPGELPEGKGLSIIPEVTYGHTHDGADTSRLGLAGVSPGLTLQTSPLPGLQLLGTVNPDFSQVESDRAQIDVNQRYSLQLKEKRPFFLEGQEWFSHPFKNLIYTRTMVTPLYGGRATAESGPWAVAGMHIWDRNPSPSINEGGGWTEDDLQDRPALASVARVRSALGADGMVGAIYSNRSVLDSDLTHQLGGFDARAPIGGGVVAEGALLVSDTTGGSDDMRAAPAAVVGASTRSRHAELDGKLHYLSPGFRSENGYLPRSDSLGASGELELFAYPKIPLLPRVFGSPIDGEIAWHQDGELRDVSLEPKAGTWFSNGALIMMETEHVGELYAERWLRSDRGGFFFLSPWTSWLTTFTNFSTGQAALYDPDDPRIGWSYESSMRLEIQPSTHIKLTPQIAWERFLLDGDTVYDGWVGRIKLEMFATPRTWARILLDRSTFEDRDSIETLFAYEREPGKAIYLGGSYAIEGDEGAIASTKPQWQVFTKLTWVFGS